MTGVEIIAAERERQQTQEGWTPDHDDEHGEGELRKAALCFLADVWSDTRCPRGWPWHWKWWKPSDDQILNLAKAGALIAAEIDRLQRAALAARPSPGGE